MFASIRMCRDCQFLEGMSPEAVLKEYGWVRFFLTRTFHVLISGDVLSVKVIAERCSGALSKTAE